VTRAARVVAPLAGLALAAGLVVASRGLDAVAREGQLGPGFWPRLVLAGVGLACLLKALSEWRRATPDPAPGAETESAGEISRARLAAGIALIVLYVLATPWLGFMLATPAFIAAFMMLAGARSALAIASNAVAGTVILLYTFVRIVYLPLPKGEGVFETLTLVVYRALRIF
jgi:putative tricarboxylic transport membrane protein